MSSRVRSLVAASAAFALAIAGLALIAAPPSVASQPSAGTVPAATLPNAVPSAITPSVDNGRVFGISQVGSKMVIGGSFTSVGGQTRNRIAAFTTASGGLSSFAPSFNGDVNAVLPGPNDHTVYVAGAFTQVGSIAAQFVTLLDLNTGLPVPGFTPPKFNYGYVTDMVQRGTRLYLTGTFTTAGGKAHAGLAALNATTGSLDPFMNVQVTGHHNDTGSGAQGWVGPLDLDVTSDGKTMVATGNFKYADGLLRDQIVMIDLTGATAQVKTDWSTSRYSPQCYNWAYDGYVRGVSFSPDNSYFVVNATGGGNNTLCDATTRWETDSTGSDVQPSWVNETGGDTVWGVTVTQSAVYVGGHNRWSNNPNGVDQAQPGAVPRPGLGALDPTSGRPLAWNPGRRPLGVAVFAMLATSEGLWIGSNNDYIGNYLYKRPKIAFFPFAGGASIASSSTPGLPGSVYLAGGSAASGTTNVLYRVNAAGPGIQALDNGPDWASDTSDPSDYRNNGSNAAGYPAVADVNSSVPATTPSAVFDSERWSPSDNPAMDWDFPVQAGTPLQVRLYFSNRCSCTGGSGQRAFDVSLDGNKVLDNYDIVADAGDQTGTMKSFNITSDGDVNIDFSHVTENPLINGIEIVRTDVTPSPGTGADKLSAVGFDGATASSAVVDNQGIDFGNWRGAFTVGNKVFYGYTDSFMYSRTINGTTFGPAVKIDPYNDAYWSDVNNDLGGTFRGVVPSLYGQLPNLTGAFYSSGKMYYTLYGDSSLHWRWFSADSGIVDERNATVPTSVDFANADGMFLVDGTLYYASRTDGKLRKASFDGTQVSGGGTVVSGPAEDGVNWKNRAMFLTGASAPPANAKPSAAFTSNCTDLSCSMDASGSTDSDGTIASYAWDFGDGTVATGRTPSHTFSAAKTYAVKLTVTDDGGATDSVTNPVTVTAPASSAVGFVGSAHGAGGNKLFQQLTVPSAVHAGDTMLLSLTRPTPSTWSGPTGITGWTEVATYANGSLTTTLWRKTAASADGGSTVRVDSTAYTHASLNLVTYSGVDTSNPIASVAQAGDAAKTNHITPTVTAGSGDWVVSMWGERSGTTTDWTPPSSVVQRDETTDTSALRVSALIADSNGPVSAGTVGGLTATTDGTSDRANMWTVALNAAP